MGMAPVRSAGGTSVLTLFSAARQQHYGHAYAYQPDAHRYEHATRKGSLPAAAIIRHQIGGNDRYRPRCRRSRIAACLPIADVHENGQSRYMTWKRLALAFVVAAVTIPASFFPIEALMTAWYEHTDPYGDGQVGLAVVMSGLYIALVCGAATFGVIFIRGLQRP
jgi:hypothetical protein